MPNTIKLKFTGRQEEGRAAGAIKPGHLIKLNGDNELVVHATAGGQCAAMFAFEDALQGKTVDDAYADDDLVTYGLALPGDEILAILRDGENANEGDGLSSNGDGTLQVVAGSEVVVAYAREALDLSAAGANAFLKVRVK